MNVHDGSAATESAGTDRHDVRSSTLS